MNVCYLCNGSSHALRLGSVRDMPELKINECNDCGLVFLSGDLKADESHYANSGMHGSVPLEIESWLQETEPDDERRFQFLKTKLIGKRVLDFGCGAGGFLLKAKKFAQNAKGVELEERLQSHFKSNFIEVWPNIRLALEKGEQYDLITAFHVVEHLEDPIHVINQLADLLSSNGEIIIEVPSSNDALLTLYQSEAFSKFTYWSQHLYLFNNSTIQKLVKKSNLKLNWIKQIQRYPLSNHLHWLSRGLPGGHKVWSFLDSRSLNAAYEAQLASAELCDTILISISK